MAGICLVSHHSAGAFSGGARGHIGGVERQTILLAHWLRDRGHEVSVITAADYPGQADEDIGGIRLIRAAANSEGIPLLRFFWPRWTSLIAALRRADPQIVVQNVAESPTGQAGIWARRNGRRFVYIVASELECARDLPVFHTRQEKILFAMGLRRANTIIAQTRVQQALLDKDWGLRSQVAPMPCAPPASADRSKHAGSAGPILWLGRVDPIKRLELLFEAASLAPELEFQLIGDFSPDSGYACKLRDLSEELTNVELLGRKTYDEVWQHYEKASLLICTSKHEGFPNTFLEAMYFGIPVVSTFDPDGIIESKGLGASVSTPRELVDALRQLKNDSEAYEAAGARCIEYFDQHHAADKALRTIEKYILGTE